MNKRKIFIPLLITILFSGHESLAQPNRFFMAFPRAISQRVQVVSPAICSRLTTTPLPVVVSRPMLQIQSALSRNYWTSTASIPSHEEFVKSVNWINRIYGTYKTLEADLNKEMGLKTLPEGLEHDDALAIYAYTTRLFRHINDHVKSQETDLQAAPYLEKLQSALRKLPPYKGAVYRKARLSSEAIEAHTTGTYVFYPQFLSTSIKTPSDTPPKYVSFVIQSKTGKDIHGLSAFPNETKTYSRKSFGPFCDF